MRYQSALIKQIHERIREAYAQDSAYTFTSHSFDDLIKTQKDQSSIRYDLCLRSNVQSKVRHMFKIVGKQPCIFNHGKYLNVYAPIESSLPRWEPDPDRAAKRKPKFEKEYTRKPKFERQFTEKDELIIDREHRRESEATPSPVLEVHNILFNLGVRK